MSHEFSASFQAANKRYPSARVVSMRSMMNLTRLEFLPETMRNSGKLFLNAMVVTASEGKTSLRMVRSQDQMNAKLARFSVMMTSRSGLVQSCQVECESGKPAFWC